MIWTYLNYLKWGAIALLFIGVSTFAWSMVDSYQKTLKENVTLKAEITKYDGRLASYKRMIDRRDAAINASQCKAKIEYWLRNPDNIPKPFDPFKNSPLSTELPDTTKQPNRVDTDPVPEWKAPDVSKLLPWNWF